MGKLHLPPTHSSASLDWEMAGNGATPRASFLRRAADAMNTIATFHKKVVQMKCQRLQAPDGGSGSPISVWPAYFRTGENTVGLRIWAGIFDTDYGAAVDPVVTFAVKLASDGSTVATKDFHFNGRRAISTSYELINRAHLIVFTLEGLVADTEHYLEITVDDGARLLYVTAQELADKSVDDAVEGVVDPTKFLVGGPIYDEHAADLLGAGAAHWKHGAAHLLTWNPDYNEQVVAVSATTYTNLIDGSSTAYSSATPGETIAALYRGHAKTPTAGFGGKIAVLARRTAGAGSLSVRLFDGTNALELTGTTTGGVGDWYTGVVTIPQSTTKWDPQAKVSAGGTTFDIAAICLFPWEA